MASSEIGRSKLSSSAVNHTPHSNRKTYCRTERFVIIVRHQIIFPLRNRLKSKERLDNDKPSTLAPRKIMPKPKSDSFTLHDLLTKHRSSLTNVLIRSFNAFRSIHDLLPVNAIAMLVFMSCPSYLRFYRGGILSRILGSHQILQCGD